MRIKIEKIEDETQNCSVVFSTVFGTAKGIWIDGVPSVGKEYIVEFDIEDTLIWGEDIVYDNNNECLIGMDNKKVIISGILESVDDDGFSVLRLDNSIIIFVASGSKLKPGKYIRITTDSIKVYDCHI